VLAFIEKAVQNTADEMKQAQEDYDNVGRGLVLHQGRPMLHMYRNTSRYPTTAALCRSCLITGLDRGVTCFLPEHSQIVALQPRTNAQVFLDVKHVDRKGTLHCSTHYSATLYTVESFDGEPVVVKQKDFVDTTYLRRQAL
jgi:hypothetical protein